MSGIPKAVKVIIQRESPSQLRAVLEFKELVAAALEAGPTERAQAVADVLDRCKSVSPQTVNKAAHNPINRAFDGFEKVPLWGPTGTASDLFRDDAEVATRRVFGFGSHLPQDVGEREEKIIELNGLIERTVTEIQAITKEMDSPTQPARSEGTEKSAVDLLPLADAEFRLAILRNRLSDLQGNTPACLLDLPTNLKSAREELWLCQTRLSPRMQSVHGPSTRGILSPASRLSLESRAATLKQLVSALEQLPELSWDKKFGFMVGIDVVAAVFPKYLGSNLEVAYFHPPANRKDKPEKAATPEARIPLSSRKGQRKKRMVIQNLTQVPVAILNFRPLARKRDGEKYFNSRVGLGDVAAGADDLQGDIALFFVPGIGSITLGSKGSLTLRGPLPLHVWMAAVGFIRAHSAQFPFSDHTLQIVLPAIVQGLNEMYQHRIELGGSVTVFHRAIAKFVEPTASAVNWVDWQARKRLVPLWQDAAEKTSTLLDNAAAVLRNQGTKEDGGTSPEDDSQGPPSIG